MVESFRLRHYKSHHDTRVRLAPLTVVAGPNSSGKTTFLEALAWSHRYVRRRHVVSNALVTSRAFTPRLAHQGIAFELNEDGEQLIFEEPEHSLGTSQRPFLDLDEIRPDQPTASVIPLRLDPRALSRPSISTTEIPTLSADGAGLATVLAYWMTYLPEKRDALVAAVREILPFVEGVRVKPARFQHDGQDVIGHELIVDTAGAKGLPASEVSEGTILIIGLMTVLVGEDQPTLLLLDDVDRGLHPGAQRQLMRWLRQLVETREGLQIVATTHSPYVIDEMDASEVWIFAADAEGKTHAKCLAAHPDAAESLQILTTGEFLSAEGEAWVVEDRGVGN